MRNVIRGVLSIFENFVVELNKEFGKFFLFGGNYRDVVFDVVGKVEVFIIFIKNWMI